MIATYISATQFRVEGDLTAEFLPGRRIKADCGGDGYRYSTITSRSYSNPYTTVTIPEGELTSNLIDVLYGIVNVGSEGSFPKHTHDSSEGQGGVISFNDLSDNDIDFLQLIDTPSSYESNKVLETTGSGIVFLDKLDSFLQLIDTPLSYESGKILETTTSGVVFVDELANFLQLEDTPTTYSGTDGQVAISTGSGIAFSNINVTNVPIVTGAQGIKFEYKSDNEVYFNPGYVHLKDSNYDTYVLGHRISIQNTGLAADTWYFIYVEESGVSNLLSAENFTFSNTVPTLDYVNQGYYNNLKRCIGFVVTDSSSNIIRFEQNGSDYWFVPKIKDSPWTNGVSTQTDVVCTLPLGSLIVHTFIRGRNDSTTNTQFYVGTPGLDNQTKIFYSDQSANIHGVSSQSTLTDSSKRVRVSANNYDISFELYTTGFQMPNYIYNTTNIIDNDFTTVSGVESFLDLTDTPTTYSGTEGHVVTSTGSGIAFTILSNYVPWDFGDCTISGTGDIYCNDLHTASGTVYIGDLKLSSAGGNMLVDDEPVAFSKDNMILTSPNGSKFKIKVDDGGNLSTEAI